MNGKSKNSFFLAIFVRSIFSSLITLLCVFVFKSQINFSIGNFIFPTCISLISFAAFLCYYKSLQQPTSGINAALTKGLSTIIIFCITTLLMHQYNAFIVLAIFFLLLGFLLLGNKKTGARKFSMYAIAAGLLWGIAFSFFSRAVAVVGSYWFAFLLEATVLFGAGFYALFIQKNTRWLFTKKSYPFSIIAIGLLTGIGSIANNICYQYYNPTAISIVAKFTVVIPLFFAVIILKQKITKVQWLGVLCLFMAIGIAIWQG